MTGSSVEALLQPSRRLDGPRRAAVQLGWYVMLQQKARYTKVRSLLDATSWYADLRKVRVLLSRRAAHR